MPSTARPPERIWIVAIADAVAAGCRVTGLVTPVPRPSRDVAAAASARATYTSPERFCESVKRSPSQPARSSASAVPAARRGAGNATVQTDVGTSGPRHGGADLGRDHVEDLEHLGETGPAEVHRDVSEPERLVAGELVHDRLPRPLHRLGAEHVAHRQLDGLHGAARGLGRGAEPGERGAQLGGRLGRRVPAVAEGRDAAKRARAVAADPDRRVRLLHRLGREADVGEAVELAVEAWVIRGPQLLEDAEHLVGAAAAVAEGDA